MEPLDILRMLALLSLGVVIGARSGIAGPSTPHPSDPFPPLDRFHVRVFGPRDGLPVSEVRDLTQGPQGHLYLATARGLSRYDGYEFQPVRLPAYRSEALVDVHTDRGGRVWALSEAGDIGYVDGDSVRALSPLAGSGRRIAETPDGDVWISGRVGLVRIDGVRSLSMTRLGARHGVPPGPARGPFAVPDGRRYVIADSSIFELREAASGTPRAVPTGRSVSDLPLDDLRSDSVSIRLLFADAAVREPGPGTDAPDLAPAARAAGYGPGEYVVRHALRAGDGTRWVAISDAAASESTLVRLTKSLAMPQNLGRHLSFAEITALYEDHEASVWVGTEAGLIQLVPRRVLALTLRDGLAEEFTAPLLQTEDGSVWVGTWGGGLHRFADGGLANRLTEARGLPSDRIRSLHETDQGELWIGTFRGAAVLRDGRVQPVAGPAAEVRDFAESPDGRLWAGTAAGLYRLTEDGFTAQPIPSLANLQIWTLHRSADGALWVGTERGLYRMSGDSVSAYGPDHGLPHSLVASVHEEEDGTLWVGTYADGLYRYRGHRFVAVTTEHGLHHDGVWGILRDDEGGAWMSSDGGIFRVSLRELHAVADALEQGRRPERLLEPLVFTEAEGLPSRECNRASPAGWRISDGRLVFNNLRGLVVISPERALISPPPPSIKVTDLQADGRPFGVETADTAGLPSGTDHLTFEFSALSFLAPDQIRYRYRLDGYDDGWIHSGTRRRARYTNLPPGRYRFRVQGASGTGEWGEPGASVALVLPPLVWETWWFRGLAGFVLIGLLATAYRYRVKHLLQVERLRLRIAADLHDDVGSNLSSIALLSQILAERASLDGLEMRQLRRIRDAADESVVALRDIIWFVDPENDELDDLVRRMRKAAGELLGDLDYDFHPPASGGRRALDHALMRNAFLVYKEALTNILRHAPGSQVTIDVSADDGQLRVRIQDTGPGFREEEVDRGRGFGNMRRRAREVGGTVKISSSPEGGTTIRFSAPMA